MSKPWEQQEGEPNDWYVKFDAFRLLGPNRSLTGAYNKLRHDEGKPKAKSSPPTWRKAANAWNWEARALAWDQRDVGRIEQEQDDRKRNWEALRQDQRNEEWVLGQEVIAKARTMLEHPINMVVKTSSELSLKELTSMIGPADAHEAYEHVQQGGVNIIIPTRWSFKDVATYLAIAKELRSHAVGKEEIGELEAIKILVDAGWFPDHVLEVAQTAMEEVGNLIRGSIEGLALGSRVVELSQANGYHSLDSN